MRTGRTPISGNLHVVSHETCNTEPTTTGMFGCNTSHHQVCVRNATFHCWVMESTSDRLISDSTCLGEIHRSKDHFPCTSQRFPASKKFTRSVSRLSYRMGPRSLDSVELPCDWLKYGSWWIYIYIASKVDKPTNITITKVLWGL